MKEGSITLQLDRRQLATIRAALRFYADESLQGDSDIRDRVIQQIATEQGQLRALDFEEVARLADYLRLAMAG